MEKKLSKYIELISGFVEYTIPVEEFESKYLHMVKKENYIFQDNIARIIETLFSDTDSYCGDPEIADYNSENPFRDIDELELRRRAKVALEELKKV